MFNWSKEWWGYIVKHSVNATAFTLAVHGGTPNLYESIVTPILYLFALEVKEALSQLKERGLNVHTFKAIWRVIKQQSATQKERSEWLLAGMISIPLTELIGLTVSLL